MRTYSEDFFRNLAACMKSLVFSIFLKALERSSNVRSVLLCCRCCVSAAFRKFDENKTGFLSVRELHAALKHLGLE
eukprot:2270791-Pleurochrysis_carterae.AAC.1